MACRAAAVVASPMPPLLRRLQAVIEGARVNSGKSSTYNDNVVRRIIGAKASSGNAKPQPPSSAPAVKHVTVDESGEGQRLDNFLVKLLKGVPKTHVYRV